ncbi:MAG: hypothetical protein KDE22_00930 [Rhodobacterales bacterium]|nr:hypothetical protein [Rhodobacterales bacterium]
MALNPEFQNRLPSQENLLLDYVQRLERHKRDRSAVHLRLSGLRPYNRREQHLRAAANSFEPLVENMDGQLFSLKSADLLFIFKNAVRGEVETVVQKVRFLFSDDPLLAESDADTQAFATWYDVDGEYDRVLHLAQSLVDAEHRLVNEVRGRMDTRSALRARQQMGEPLTPQVLDRVVAALARADLSNMVRRQYVCQLDTKMVPSPVFSELFISIADLRETLLPGVNLLSNRWLFQHLTETLDRRMLAMLTRTDHITLSGDIAFNMNISTLLSPEFLTFDDNITASRRGSMIIELQKVDIFADLGAYLFAREFVQEKGYRVCVDGLTYHTMSMIDRDRLGADLVKVIWHPEMVDGGAPMHDRLRALIASAGENRVVLCRVDNREAIDFGRSVGITLFQGRHVEQLIAEDNRRRELLRLKRRIERG